MLFASKACTLINERIAGTNPIHNKKPKKEKKELDEDEVAFKAKQQAGGLSFVLLDAGAFTESWP